MKILNIYVGEINSRKLRQKEKIRERMKIA
jgi:hypothetical protein